MSTNNELLINFLKDTLGKLENHQLDTESMEKLGEFYMSSLFDKRINMQIENGEMSEKDFWKFLITGWYIYKCVLKK